jgi:hypothetical protein
VPAQDVKQIWVPGIGGWGIAAQELIIERRKANVTAARAAIDTIRNHAAQLCQQITRDEADARPLERDITRAEADLERGVAGWWCCVSGSRRLQPVARPWDAGRSLMGRGITEARSYAYWVEVGGGTGLEIP